MYPDKLTWRDAARYAETRKPVILPVGSMEGHGYHLPLNTDTLIAGHVARRVAQRAGLISLPPITYTLTVVARPGNISLTPPTLKATLIEVVESLIKMGFRRFLIVRGHGGPDMVEAIVEAGQELVSRHGEIFLGILHVRSIIGHISNIDVSRDTHAGEWETSLMLHFDDTLVGDERVKEFDLPSKHGVHGDSTIATKEKGEELAEGIVGWILNWIKEKETERGIHHDDRGAAAVLAASTSRN